MICWAARNEKLILREGIWFYEEKIVCMDSRPKVFEEEQKKIEKIYLVWLFKWRKLKFADSLAKCG